MITLFGGNSNIDLNWWTFPGGERNVKILDPENINRFGAFTVYCWFKGSTDLIDMLLLVNAVRNVNKNAKLRLCIPYFPFARQDRVMTEGEPLALQVAVNLIKSCNFTEVEVWDPHSDVLAGMFDAGHLKIVPQETLITLRGIVGSSACIVSPDAGALKKVYKVAKANGNLPVLCASKNRDVSTGQIISTTVDPDVVKYDTIHIVDDICDGGKTFIELASAIRKIHETAFIILYVTHGIFSKGLEPLHEVIDEVHAVNNLLEVV